MRCRSFLWGVVVVGFHRLDLAHGQYLWSTLCLVPARSAQRMTRSFDWDRSARRDVAIALCKSDDLRFPEQLNGNGRPHLRERMLDNDISDISDSLRYRVFYCYPLSGKLHDVRSIRSRARPSL